MKACEGFESDIDQAPVTRWYESNTFYRKPTINGPLRVNPGKLEEAIGSRGFVNLIAPDTFAELCDDTSDIDTKANVHQLYEQIVGYFGARSHIGSILLRQVLPAKELLSGVDELPTISQESLELLASASTRTTILVSSERDKGVSGTFSSAHDEVWLPVIDTTTPSAKEKTAEQISEDITNFKQSSPQLTRFVLTNSVDFERLPLPAAQDKVRLLGALSKQVRALHTQEGTL